MIEKTKIKQIHNEERSWKLSLLAEIMVNDEPTENDELDTLTRFKLTLK